MSDSGIRRSFLRLHRAFKLVDETCRWCPLIDLLESDRKIRMHIMLYLLVTSGGASSEEIDEEAKQAWTWDEE